METDADQVKTNVTEGDFGGDGARQVLGAAMKAIEYFDQVLIVGLTADSEETHIYHSSMSNAELALILARVSGYGTLVINGWSDNND